MGLRAAKHQTTMRHSGCQERSFGNGGVTRRSLRPLGWAFRLVTLLVREGHEFVEFADQEDAVADGGGG